jgi:general nucleoside transport system permease protein
MRFEIRERPSLSVSLAAPTGALLVSFAICGIAIALSGASPLAAYWEIAVGALGSRFAVTETLTRATPLIFTGLAVAVAFRARLWNIGAEGQLYAGAVVTIALGTGFINAPGIILIPLLFIAGAVAGGLVLLGPAILKTRLGVDEVVTTLLLNFIIILFVSLLLDGPMKDPIAMGWPQSMPVVPEATLARLMPPTRLHLGLLIALAAALVVWFINSRTVWGYEMRAVGANSEGARFAGMPVNATIVRVALFSGALAGMAGVVEILGVKHDLTIDLSPGYGYSGIVVAMLAALHPLGVVPAAIFVAGIFVGADAMSRTIGVSSYIAEVITAVSLLSMLVAIMIVRYRIRWS